MTVAFSLTHAALLSIWAFYAYGPQLVICLLFAWSAYRRTRGDLLAWMITGFLLSIIPFAGAVAMWWLWRRASREVAGVARP